MYQTKWRRRTYWIFEKMGPNINRRSLEMEERGLNGDFILKWRDGTTEQDLFNLGDLYAFGHFVLKYKVARPQLIAQIIKKKK